MRRLLSALALLACVGGVAGQRLADDPAVHRPALFPGAFGLDEKWQATLGQPLSPDIVAGLLLDDPSGAQLVPWPDGRHLSIWAALQQRLAGQARTLAALAAAQDGPARGLLARRSRDDLAETLGIARRYPWAPAVQRALVETGEHELRAGRAGLAGCCFRDVLARSTDAALRDRARVGLWLAAAHDADETALADAFAGIDPEARFPWLGDTARAADIRARLTAGRDAAPAVTLNGLKRQILDVPNTSAWGIDRPASHPEGVAVAGPGLLAWFDGGAKPLWVQRGATLGTPTLWGPLVPGPFEPAVGAGRVVTRWDVQPLRPGSRGDLPVHVAAFDLRTGRPAWSTAGNADWEGFCPVADPTFAEGRVYVLAAQRRDEYAPLALVCLDAEAGGVLWQRELLTFHTTLTEPAPLGTTRGQGVDVAHLGNAVAVAGGRVYCQTNVGAVACCDARDGLVEWVRSYPQDRAVGDLRRQGAVPVVHGGWVVFLPRDALGLFALDAATGTPAWTKADDLSLRVLGRAGGTLVLAEARAVRGVDLATGRGLWERNFAEAIDGRATLAGASVIVGTGAGLVRLDAASGQVLEEDDWGAGGPLNGLAVHGDRLLGSNVPPAPPPAGGLLAFAGGSVRVVYLAASPVAVDGRAADWEPHAPTAWTGPGGVRGRLLATHDGERLTLGVSAAGPNFDAKQARLDLALSVDGKPARWTLRLDPRGQVAWESATHREPEGAVSAARTDGDTATFEVSVPLAALQPTRDPKLPGPGRLPLELALRTDDPSARAGSLPLVRVLQGLSLHWLTAPQEAAVRSLADALPDLPASWERLEELWRVAAPAGADLAAFYRDRIRRRPNDPGVGTALLRLDRLLRRGLDSKPLGEVLPLAEEAGVPEAVRAGYRQTSGAYLSQWVHVEPRSRPEEVFLELFDGRSWGHRVAAGIPGNLARDLLRGGRNTRVGSFNGRTTITIDGVRIDPNQPARKRAGHVVPSPPSGVWHEFRIPLVWLDLAERPIHGLAFGQVGGGTVYWDRTTLVRDGKEIVLLDDAADGATEGDWRWLDDQVKSGKFAHSHPPPPSRDEPVRRAVVFKKAVRDHLPGAVVVGEKERRAVAERLPGAPLDGYTGAVYERVEGLLRPMPERLREVQRAILTRATAAEVPLWLDRFLRREYAAGAEEPAEAVAALVEKAGLPASVAEDFRRRARHEFVRAFQVIGPFAQAGGPERDGVHLDRQHDGVSGRVRWQPVAAKTARIDLGSVLAGKPGVVYAACWVHSARAQAALVQVGSQDGIALWVNRKEDARPLLEEATERTAVPAQNSARVELAEGWNEVLLRVESRTGRAALFFELRAPDNSGPLDGVRHAATPP